MTFSNKSSEELLNSPPDNPNQELNTQMAGTDTDSDSDKSKPTSPKKKPLISNLISPLSFALFSLLQPRSSTFLQLLSSAQIKLDCQNRKIAKAITKLEKLQPHKKQAQDRKDRQNPQRKIKRRIH